MCNSKNIYWEKLLYSPIIERVVISAPETASAVAIFKLACISIYTPWRRLAHSDVEGDIAR